VRVVDLTSYTAGSYAAMQLADLGASVIKVESLEGDSFRELPGFFGWNRGKRSLAVDLKTAEGRGIVHRLAKRADVVMENMRPGVADRLGVGYEPLSAINPRLVYSSVTAFGSSGPNADRPGFDPIFLAVGNQTFWVKLCKALDLEDLANDPRFASWLARLENNQALLPLIDAKFKSNTREHWLELLAKHDIPAAPVQTVAEFMQHPSV